MSEHKVYEHRVYPEAMRNRLLRRADWRFLLADAVPAKSICFAGGLLAKSVRLISEDVMDAADYQAGHDGSFDLAVVADPAPATLQAAWQALRPGGALYGEWNKPLAATSTRVTRQLVEIGFTLPACYWPSSAPEQEAPGAWLPLAAPGALRYYAQSRSVATGAAHKTILHAKWLLWQGIAGLGIAMPLCAVAYKPMPDAEPAGFPVGKTMGIEGGVLRHLCQEWQALGLDARPEQLHWLLLTGGLRSINKAVRLVFADNEIRPRLAVKMARVPESLPALAHEAEVLRAVHGRQRGEMAGVPQVLFFGGGLGETALMGVPLWTQVSRSNFADLATRATDWQVCLAGDITPVERTSWWDRLVASELVRFSAAFGSAVDGQQFRRAAERLEILPDLPLVCEQRDFSPWNVLLNGKELVVLDWESAELDGLPMLDMIYFLTYLALFVEGVPVHGAVDVERVRRVYRATLEPHDKLGAVVQANLSAYARQLGLSSEVQHPLRLLTWMIHARSEYQAMWAECEKTPDAHTLRRSVFLHLWEEELAVGGSQV